MNVIYPSNTPADHFHCGNSGHGGLHASLLAHLDELTGFALIIGEGVAETARQLATQGWEVIASESPGHRIEEQAQGSQPSAIQWIDDKLPDLEKIRRLGQKFNLILVQSAWAELPAAHRERAFRILSELLAPKGKLMISHYQHHSLRDAADDGPTRSELESLARKRALTVVQSFVHPDRNDSAIEWDTIVFGLPDDGTGTLPLLRHIVINDNKSSTYKLGLLLTLTRIADNLPGVVLRRSDDWVEIPLGAVGLFWIKIYRPLILKHALRQASGDKGYGFAREAFYALQDQSPFDLRLGAMLDPQFGSHVLTAIQEATTNIAQMPVRYTTWPGTNNTVFECQRSGARPKSGRMLLDRELLSTFGIFRVPTALWDCFSRYACWLEPAIINEWVNLMRRYQPDASLDILRTALLPNEGHADERDTGLIRKIAGTQLQDHSLRCLWTGRALREKSWAVDHCFPWARCNNNDLWNLFPVTQQANQSKSDKLPSASLLHASRERILAWWDEAFIGTEHEARFYAEALSALPMIERDDTSLDALFQGISFQRARLRTHQQLQEWCGLGTS